mmetsp:Transcript_18961/g.41077  ORF Transcript_18961/g.41077 Transcript_18961/m.41077 type:complete len:89 (+) Transcript_18961:59-325(+)
MNNMTCYDRHHNANSLPFTPPSNRRRHAAAPPPLFFTLLPRHDHDVLSTNRHSEEGDSEEGDEDEYVWPADQSMPPISLPTTKATPII